MHSDKYLEELTLAIDKPEQPAAGAVVAPNYHKLDRDTFGKPS